MEETLAAERAAEQYALQLMGSFIDHPLGDILAALSNYHQLAQVAALSNLANAAEHEMRLWAVQTEARKHLHRALSNFRKSNTSGPVETRQMIKAFLEWIKQSQRNFRSYIFQLSALAGGIPELQAIAQSEKGEGLGEIQQPAPAPELRAAVIESCHRVLVYLGDLSRYRASEKLDKKPDFGPAIGYYGLAATLMPASGLGHHQQAVVALEQRHHLRAVYHLYRAMCVKDAHPNALNNLRLEFEKTNAAWDKGELVHKGPPKDPDASKHALVGWFVRFHGMCFKGEEFRGHTSLEREVLGHLTNVVRERPLGDTLLRMLLVNVAAQHSAGEGFQKYQTSRYQQSFYYYFRFNLKTFTTLLEIYYDDLLAHILAMRTPREAELTEKLTGLGRRLLPSLRLYNQWLPTMLQMIEGLSTDDFIAESVASFWPAYAKVLDLVAQAFPIWDLDDLPNVDYMLEEDVDTLEFIPFSDESSRKTWRDPRGTLKPRFSDVSQVRLSSDEEMLHRLQDFLSVGTGLVAGNVSPIRILGTRFYLGNVDNIAPLTISEPVYEEPKPISYASAAANGQKRQAGPSPALNPPSSTKTQSRENQLSRMVDELVEEEDVNNPVTPPQQVSEYPAILSNGELHNDLQDSISDATDLNAKPRYAAPISRPFPRDFGDSCNMAMTSPGAHRSPNGFTPANQTRLESVSMLWGTAPSSPTPSFPSGLPVGTLSSPQAHVNGHRHAHSRVNSASSIRSKSSLNFIDSWGSMQTNEATAPRLMPDSIIQNAVYGTDSSSLDQVGMTSPLLFGAAHGPWSTGRHHSAGQQQGFSPNGHGG